MPAPSPNELIRVGVIGAGRIGRVHAGNLAFGIPGATLAMVADADPAAAADCARALRLGEAHTSDYRRLLDDPTIRAVVIASPTDTHARLIEEAAAHGKDIFCEKPIDLDLGRVDAALAAVAQAGVRLQVGFNRRFDPSFARAKQIITSGGIGTPQLIRLSSRDPRPAGLDYLAVSGGLFTDMTIHDFDAARWLMGDEVESLSAMGSVLIDPAIGGLGDVDTAIVQLKFRSGALGAIDNSRKAIYGYDVRAEVFGSEGSVAIGHRTADAVVHMTAEGPQAAPPLDWFIERFREAYLAELLEFVSSIREDRAPSVTGADGRVPLLMAKAAWRSLKEGRAVSLTEGATVA